MSPTPHPGSPSLTPQAANEAIRKYVAGRTLWSPQELAELDRLRTDWQRALLGQITTAA